MIRGVRYFFVILIFSFAISSFSQSNNSIIELETQLKFAMNDSLKMTILNEIGYKYLEDNPIRSVTRAKKALRHAKNINNFEGQFSAIDILLTVYDLKKPNVTKASKYLNEMKAFALDDMNELQKAKLSIHEGRFYLMLADFSKAQNAYFIARDVLESFNAQEELLVDVYFEIGQLNFMRNDMTSSLHYLEKALLRYKDNGDDRGLARTLLKLGEVYDKTGDDTRFMRYSKKALAISKTLNDTQLLAESNLNISRAYLKSGSVILAQKHINYVIDLDPLVLNDEILANAYISMADIQFYYKNDTLAIRSLQNALFSASNSKNDFLRRDIYNRLYSHYDSLGVNEIAFSYLKEINNISNSLYDKEKQDQLIKNKVKYETEKKESENKLLKQRELESNIVIQNQRFQNYVMMAFIVLGLIAFLFWFSQYRQKKVYYLELEKEVEARTVELAQTNEKLNEMNDRLGESNTELERFAYIASHDLKSHLRNIISFLGLLERKIKDKSSDEELEYLAFAKNNANQMHDLIRDILEFSRMERKKTEDLIDVDLNISLVQAIQNLKGSIAEKNAHIRSDYLPSLKASNSQIIQVFQNLIGNGIKYNKDEEPEVSIYYKLEEDKHHFTIKDNGIGVKDEYKDKIFEMFKRLHTKDEYQGTGIGLSIVKKIISNLNGRIWVDTQDGEGSEFHFVIPLNDG